MNYQNFFGDILEMHNMLYFFFYSKEPRASRPIRYTAMNPQSIFLQHTRVALRG